MLIDKLGRFLLSEYKTNGPQLHRVMDILKTYYTDHDRNEMRFYNQVLETHIKYKSYNKIPIIDNDKFTVNFIKWKHFGGTDIHEHTQRCTYMLFDGELIDTRYIKEDGTITINHATIVKPGDIISLEQGIYHKVINLNTGESLSLHLYDKN